MWMTRPMALDSILEFIHCGCKTGCETQRCSRKKAMMQCTDICTCAGFMNAEFDDEQSGKEKEEEKGLDLDIDNDFPRANDAKRRSRRKPGARVTNFVLGEFKVVARGS